MALNRALFRRRRYVVKKGLQFRYIGLLFALAILASIVTGWTVFVTGWSLLGEKLADVYPQGRLLYVIRVTNMALLRNLLLISPIIFILGLLFSHRIAGPLYRIEKTLYEIIKGNLTLKIRLREGDELSTLADAVNIMTENFNKIVTSDKVNLTKIKMDLNEVKTLISSSSYDTAKLESLINEIDSNINELIVSSNKWST